MSYIGLHHKISKVTEAIGQLTEETRHEIQSVRDDLNPFRSCVGPRPTL
jgi:hypothetical protein